MTEALPIIDVGAFLEKRASAPATAREIEKACRESGFFYATGHGVGGETVHAPKEASARFFALPEASKMEIAIARGGRAWRGYFPLGEELTSGVPDLKEGLYFGEDLDASDPRVTAGWPLHGANLFPEDVPELAGAVRTFMAQAERAAHAIMAGIAVSLGLDAAYFHSRYTNHPTLLLRIFHYPPSAVNDARWGGRGAHGLRLAHLARARRCGRLAGKDSAWLARSATDTGNARMQYWRHARSSNRRVLSFDPASRAQHEWQGTLFVPVLL